VTDPSASATLAPNATDDVLERWAVLAASSLRASSATAALLLADGSFRIRSTRHTPSSETDDGGESASWAEVMASGRPRILRDPLDGAESLTRLAVPLRHGTETFGVLSVGDTHPREWSEEEIGVLEGLASGLAEVLSVRASAAAQARTQRELADTVYRLNAFMDQSPIVAFMKDLDGRYVYVNPEFENCFGLTAGAGQEDWTSLTPEADLEARTADRGVIASGTRQEFRLPFPTRDGSERIWRVFKFPIVTGDGESFIGGVAIDVTDSTRAADALEDSKRQLNEAQAIAHIGSWEWDLVTDSSSSSDEHSRLFGFEPGSVDFTYDVVRTCIHPDDLASHDAAVMAAIAGEPMDDLFRVIHPDGRVVHLHSRGAVERDENGNAIRLFGTIQDVTELEHVSQALRASEERYRRIVEAAGDIIFEVDAQGHFTYANPATLRVLGYDTDEIIGRHYTELMRPDHHAAAAELYRRQVNQRIPTTYFEFPALSRGGAEVWLGQVAQLVISDDRVVGLHAVARDISARREVDRMKSEFVSIVSHELRTPLTSLRGSLGLLASGKLGNLTEAGHRMVEIAIQNTDRLVRLINEILDLERLESGALVLKKQPSSAAELVQGAVNAVQGLAERVGTAIETSVPEVTLHVDPDAITQVLTNLLSNAIKFSRADRGGLIRVGVEESGDETLFHVRDQGRGIPADKLGTVFDRFQQVDSSDAREKGGTGLGLAISRSIVEHHGGRIWAESVVDKGSTFYFALPRSAASGAGLPLGAPA